MFFIDYPEIYQISAKINDIKYVKEKTYFTLNRTIFLPNNRYLVREEGFVNDLPLEGVYERAGRIIHLVSGRLNENEDILLRTNKDQRTYNLTYNTALIIFTEIFDSLYNRKAIHFKRNKDFAQIIIDDFSSDFNQASFEKLINTYIRSNLPIKVGLNDKGIGNFSQIKNPCPTYKKTGQIFGIKILNSRRLNNKLLIDFLAGNDYLKFNEKNEQRLKIIKKICLSDLDSNEKINKIINEIN